MEDIFQIMAKRQVFLDKELQINAFGQDEKRNSELLDYLNFSGQRLFYVFNLIKKLIQSSKNNEKVRILDIGANPYFLTTVLLHFLKAEVDVIDRPPVKWPGEIYSETFQNLYVSIKDTSLVYEVTETICNVEKDNFPFSNHCFDIVIAGEILEHLTTSPTNFLYEIHRILKPNGYLLLTTPNAIQAKYLYNWFRGVSSWDKYSGYGVYGRHQREYTINELKKLLNLLNFEIFSIRSLFFSKVE